jgi:paraquat-inducible protein B
MTLMAIALVALICLIPLATFAKRSAIDEDIEYMRISTKRSYLEAQQVAGNKISQEEFERIMNMEWDEFQLLLEQQGFTRGRMDRDMEHVNRFMNERMQHHMDDSQRHMEQSQRHMDDLRRHMEQAQRDMDESFRFMNEQMQRQMDEMQRHMEQAQRDMEDMQKRMNDQMNDDIMNPNRHFHNF